MPCQSLALFRKTDRKWRGDSVSLGARYVSSTCLSQHARRKVGCGAGEGLCERGDTCGMNAGTVPLQRAAAACWGRCSQFRSCLSPPPTSPSMLFTLSPAAFQAAPIAQVKSHKLTARQQAVHILSHNIKTTNYANSRPHDQSFWGISWQSNGSLLWHRPSKPS